MTVGARNSVPSLEPPSCIRPEPGRGGGAGKSSLSLGFDGFGDAAVEDVAVLAGAAGFFVKPPLGVENGMVSDFRCVCATAGAGGFEGILSVTADTDTDADAGAAGLGG